MTKIIDGKQLATNTRKELKIKIDNLKQKNIEIGLAVVLVGNNSASEVYVRNKIKGCEEVGIKSYSFYLAENTTQEQLEELVNTLSNDKKINGILVQLPLPKHINQSAILKLIPASKDVDGFCAENVGNLLMNEKTLVACTPFGVLQMLKSENIEISGKNAVVVGRSNIVGKPMALLLLHENATVTICHSQTKNIKEVCANADILVVAIGKAKFITADMVKDGAVVIDVGMNRVDGKLCGDVDFENVKEKTSYITPVPGGVGPMTITMLLNNTYISACRSNHIE